MKIRISNNGGGKVYNLPENAIITVIGNKLGVRVCFHWAVGTPEDKPEIDIDGCSIGMYDENENNVIPAIHGVCEEDKEEFENWYKCIS